MLFDPATDPGPAHPPLNDEARDNRALARSALASLVFDGASQIEVLEGQRRLTVRRIQNHPTPVLIDAVFPRADGGLSAFRLCNSARRLAGPHGNPGGPQSHNHHLIRLGEPVLDIVTAALAPGIEIDGLPLSDGLRWRRAEDESLLSMAHQ